MILLALLIGCNQPANDSVSAACPDDIGVFQAQVWEPVLSKQCVGCHVEGGVASNAALRLDPEAN